MTETASIYKGDTFLKRVGYRLDDGTLATLPGSFTCKIKASAIGVERPVTDVGPDDDGTANKRFLASLSPTETLAFPVGQHVVVVEIENTSTTPPLRKESHIILTVSEHGIGSTETLAPPTELDRLKAHREALLDAKDEAVGGSTIEVWNGRYGNKMKQQAMTYDQICTALERNRQEIATEERIAGGGSRRGGVAVVWAH
jgi:hypothetical protein